MWKLYEILILISVVRLFWNTTLLTHLHIVYGSFQIWPQSVVVATRTSRPAEPYIFTTGPLKKPTLSPALNDSFVL